MEEVVETRDKESLGGLSPEQLSEQMAHEIRYAISNLNILEYPFPHFQVNDIFSEEVYTAIESHWPEPSQMIPLGETGLVSPRGAYNERYTIDLVSQDINQVLGQDKGNIWHSVLKSLTSLTVNQSIISKFKSYFPLHPWLSCEEKSWGLKNYAMIHSDMNHYTITPHTQAPNEMLVLLFYFAHEKNTEDAGTSLFIPKEEGRLCVGNAHHKREDFVKIKTIPYRRNVMFGFFKTSNSFHGVDPVCQEVLRRVLYYGVGVSENG